MTSEEYILLVNKMLDMQSELDKSIMKEFGLKEIDRNNLRFAILDEIGELTHELKSEWCWWKKTQSPVDKEKLLGELVDIWHFVLSFENNFGRGKEWHVEACDIKEAVEFDLCEAKKNKKYLFDMFWYLFDVQTYMIESIVSITEYLGFTIEQVYEAYCDKNKINYQRLKEGY